MKESLIVIDSTKIADIHLEANVITIAIIRIILIDNYLYSLECY